MANITKQALIQEIAKSTGFVRNDIKTVIEQFLDLLAEKLIEGNTIEIRGFGTFACKPRKARPARNPRTGETVLIEERMVPSFKFSNDIKDKINSLEAIVEGVNAKLESEGSDVMIAVQSQESPTDTESKSSLAVHIAENLMPRLSSRHLLYSSGSGLENSRGESLSYCFFTKVPPLLLRSGSATRPCRASGPAPPGRWLRASVFLRGSRRRRTCDAPGGTVLRR